MKIPTLITQLNKLVSRRMRFLFFIIFIIASLKSSGQKDTEFWFAAPEVDSVNNSGLFDRPILLRITSSSTAASVTINQPANSGFVPININIPANSTTTVVLTNWLNDIENGIPNAVQNKGLHITSSAEITAYYEVQSLQCRCNPELFALKGRNAIGNEFYIPSQLTWAIDTVRHPNARAAFDIVATEDNTSITVTPNKALIGRPAGIPFNVTLNKGQTFSCQALYHNGGNLLNGSSVLSNKPVAVTTKEDLLFTDGDCADLAGDQLIPTSVIGSEYAVVRGNLTVRDKVVILAVSNNTLVYLDGNPLAIATLNAGQSYEADITSSPSLYIKSSKNVYVLHYSGNTCEVGSAVIPKLNCTGSNSVSIVRSDADGAYVFLVTKNGNQNSFQVNGNPGTITASDFQPLAGTSGAYVFCKKEISAFMPLNAATTFVNNSGKFQLGFLNGSTFYGGCMYGYFSDYKKSNVTSSQGEICVGDSLQLTAFGGVKYVWTPSQGLNNSGIANPKASPAATTDYKVVITDADGCIDSAFSKVIVNTCNVLPGNGCLKVLQANYGGNASDIAYDIVSAGNGQFYMVGNTNSFGAGGTDILVIKMDAAKNILWSKTYGVAGNETIRKATASPNGGLLITGQTTSFNNPSGDILCLKVDASGNVVWMRTFGVGSVNGDLGSEIIQTADGGYAITGILDVAGNVADGVVIRLDASANLLWSKRYNSGIGEDGSGIIEVGTKLVVTSDIEYRSGNDYGLNISEFQISNGNLLLSKNIISTAKGIFRPLIYKDFSNSYWISGHLIEGSDYNQMEQVVLKLTNTYTISKTYKIARSPLTNFYYTGFAPLKSGGFITCASEPNTAGGKGHIYKVNSDGSVAFSKQISTSGKNSLNALSVINSKVFAVGADNSSGDDNYYLAEFDTSGNGNNICNVDTSLISIQNHPFTVSDYTWSSVVDQPFNNTVQNLTASSQTINTNVICAIDTCKIVTPDFTIPDTVCVNTPVNITNKSVGATSYYWNFCVADINQTPEFTNLGNPGNYLLGPVFTDFVSQQGNYFAFVVNNWNGTLTRLDFGNSLLNTPVAVDLGNLNGVLSVHAEGIQIVHQNNKWFAFIVGGDSLYETPFIIKVEFGADIANLSPLATNLGNLGNMNQPIDFYMFQDGFNWFGFTVNAKNNSIVRFSFGSDFSSNVGATNLGNIGGLNYPTGINAINKNGKWYVYIVNAIKGNIIRYDFGSSLLNIPVAVDLGNPGNSLNEPRDIYMLQFCGGLFAFVVNNGTDDIVRLDFHDNPEGIPTAISLGNAGNFSFPHSISKFFRVGGDLYSLITNVDNHTISRLRFAGCNNANVPNSALKNPGAITYTTPGTYNINLTIDDGLPTQASVCKQVVVMPKPAIDFSYSQDDCNFLKFNFFGSDSSNKTKWDFGDGTIVTGVQNIEHIYSKTGVYKVSFFYNGFCPSSISKDIFVSISFADVVKNKDTIVCENSSLQLLTDSASSYCWTPSNYLNNPFIANPIAKPLKDITYRLQSKVPGKNLVINGDFSKGNIDFSSTYVYSSNGIPEGVYYVDKSPNPWNPAMPFCNDHTTGTSNMLLVNGATRPRQVVWEQTINISANTVYEFSFWAQNITTLNPSKLQFSINDIPLGTVFKVNDNSCLWERFFTDWSSGSNTTAKISVLNMNQNLSGNDFALDDISFATISYKTDSLKIVLDKPLVKANNDTALCANGNLQLNAVGAAKYSWSPIKGLNDSTIANPIATITDSAVRYIVTGTSSKGCIATDTVNIGLFPPPVINVSGDTSICGAGKVQLHAFGGAKYQWTPSNSLDNASSNNPIASVTVDAMYHVTITGANGCSASDSVNITVLPTLIASVSNDTMVCAGSKVQLLATGGTTYQWLPPNTLNNSSLANPIAAPLANTTYSVTVSNANGCVAKKFVSVDVLPLPAIKMTHDTTVCRLGAVQLNASGALFYHWSPATGLDNSNTSSPIASIQSTIRYFVVVADANNCTSTDSVLIDVHPQPQFGVVMLDASVCAGTSVQLKAFGGDRYEWLPADDLSDATVADPTVILQSSRTYTVKIIESVCKEQAIFNIPIVIKALPALVVTKSNDITCNMPSAILNGNIVATSYLWAPSVGLSDPSIANPVASPTSNTVYTLTIVDTSGCVSGGSIEVKVLNNSDFKLYQMPTAFTPNGDGKNDCFGVAKWGSTNIVYFLVYNRWGQQVFKGSDSRPCWDGAFGGRMQPGGNYVYKLKVQTLCGIVERNGSIVLIR